jgi:hypothetical protein
MRIIHSQHLISVRDQVGPFWALGLFLLAGGVAAVAMPLGLASNAEELEPWERYACGTIGIGVIAGALWWLRQNPSTRVHLDLLRRQLRLERSGLRLRETRQLQFDDLAAVRVVQGTDSDGGAVWRPAVRLRDGQLVLLSELWSHDRAAVEKAVEVVAEACGLPSPADTGDEE